MRKLKIFIEESHTPRQKRNQWFPSDKSESRICALDILLLRYFGMVRQAHQPSSAQASAFFAVKIGGSQLKMSRSMEESFIVGLWIKG